MDEKTTSYYKKEYPDLDDEFKKPVNQTKGSSVNQNKKNNDQQSSFGHSAADSPTLRSRRNNRENSKGDDDGSDSDESLPAEEKSGTGWPSYYVIIIVLAVVAIVIVPYFMYGSEDMNSSPGSVLDEKKADELYDLENKFPTQTQNLWTTIVAGVKKLYSSDPQRPCILLLLLNEDDVSDKSLQQDTGECIARLVAKRVVKHMSSKSEPALLDASTVTASDYGDTLQFLTKKITSQKALVITNLQELSGSVAQSLHVLCDRYNPMVRDALVVFTLKSKKRGTDENVASFVQRTLTKLWENDVPPDKLSALVTRIAGSVVSVITEKNLPNECMFP